MTLYWIPGLIGIAVLLLVDYVIYRRLKHSERLPHGLARLHVGLAGCLYALLAVAVCIPSHRCSNAMLVLQMWLLYVAFAIPACKMLFLLFYSVSWIRRLPGGVKWAFRVIGVVVGIAAVVECALGVLVNPYRLQVNRVTIESDRLPQEFDGYRVVQFSDSHLGTYNGDTAFVSRYVDTINALKPDLLCFTGDIENRLNSEVVPYKPILSRLRARDGVYSIRGNHDVGVYYKWPSKLVTDFQGGIMLRQMEADLGWTLLTNSSCYIHRGSSKIALIGIDGFGNKYGDIPPDGNLHMAYPTYRDSIFKIVLHHSPELWSDTFRRNTRIDLILCGHTHAMQMMVTIAGHRFSPAMFQYPQWGGLYTDASGERNMYVNIGLGEVGMPGRLGSALPEITVITLKRKPLR